MYFEFPELAPMNIVPDSEFFHAAKAAIIFIEDLI
jgi:hypothetical protein